MSKHKMIQSILLGTLLLAGTLNAQLIQWGPVQTCSTDSDVVTNGTLVCAYAVNAATTVNGVSFEKAQVGLRLAFCGPMPGDCMTCTEMSRSGARIAMSTPRKRGQTRTVPPQGLGVYSAAAERITGPAPMCHRAGSRMPRIQRIIHTLDSGLSGRCHSALRTNT